MAYRSTDPNELELRERRTQLRREHDELQERADQLARELAEHGGVLGAIKNLIGGKTEDEVTRARSDHAALETKIAALVEAERDVDAKLARIDATRAELEAQEAARIETARAAAGPLGEQLRAIAADRTLAANRLAEFNAVLREALRAATVVDEIENAVAPSAAVTVAKAVYNTAGVLTAGDVHTGDREARESRRKSHVELACTTIHNLVEGFARLQHAWPDPKPIELATRQLAAQTTQAFEVAGARDGIDRLDRVIVSERDALARTLAQLDERERELVRNA